MNLVPHYLIGTLPQGHFSLTTGPLWSASNRNSIGTWRGFDQRDPTYNPGNGQSVPLDLLPALTTRDRLPPGIFHPSTQTPHSPHHLSDFTFFHQNTEIRCGE
jgi:hypothetical protein